MSRVPIKIFLIICLGWQLLAFAGFNAALSDVAHKQHELLHFMGVAHHHHDDVAASHVDESAASVAHAVLDSSLFSPALPTLLDPVGLRIGADQLAADRHAIYAQAFPDGLERPPKYLA